MVHEDVPVGVVHADGSSKAAADVALLFEASRGDLEDCCWYKDVRSVVVEGWVFKC